MAPRPPRRASPQAGPTKPRRAKQGDSTKDELPVGVEDITARAARLGITPERVLLEYARIAFADLRRIVEWTAEGWRAKPLDGMSRDDADAIAEIVPGSDPQHPRIKLYDRKAALDAIARHLGMFPLPARRPDEPAATQEDEDPREFLIRELARLAASAGAEPADPLAEPGAGAKDQA